jgi:hypothetical protein
MTTILSRFPKLELSYETVHHKKVCASDSVALAIPMGKKHFVWVRERLCYLVDLNKEKTPVAFRELDIVVPAAYLLETVLYVTHNTEHPNSPFIVEEIYMWKGMNLSNLCFGDRLGFLHDFMCTFESCQKFVLPGMWPVSSGSELTANIPLKLGYAIHHIQYREMRRHAPYINFALPRKGVIQDAKPEPKKATVPVVQLPKFDYAKPQFRHKTVFQVVADVQFDIYHAYAEGANGLPAYCGLLGVSSYKMSVFMNSIFRKIRENRNLDYIEESDDEADFENMDETKYVDLEKVANIECAFHSKFRKWVPLRVVTERAVPIERLVYDSNRVIHQEKNRNCNKRPHH